MTAVGDPDQNIYAWRGASLFNLLDFPRAVPARRRLAVGPSSRSTRTSARARWILEAADVADLETPRRSSGRTPTSASSRGSRTATGRGARRAVLRRVERGGVDRRAHPRACTTAGEVVRRRGALPLEPAVLPRCSRRSRNARSPRRSSGSPGCLRLPEIVEVLAYARAVSDPLASVALAEILLGPRYRVGYKDLALVAALAKREELRVASGGRGGGRGHAVPVRRGARASRRGRAALGRGARAARGVPATSCAELRIEARSPSGEFLGEIIRRTGLLAELDAQTDQVTATAAKAEPRRVPGRGARVRAGRGRADAPRVPRLRGHGGTHGQAGVVAGAALRRGLRQGHDDPRREGPRVRQRLRARDGERTPAQHRGSSTTPPSARSRWTSSSAATRRCCRAYDGVLRHFKEQLQAQEEFEERRTAYVALTRARRRLFVTGAHWYGENINAKEGGRFLEELAGWAQTERHADVGPGRGHRRGHEPTPRVSRARS